VTREATRPDRHRPGVPCQTMRVRRCDVRLQAGAQITLLVDTDRLAVLITAVGNRADWT